MGSLLPSSTNGCQFRWRKTCESGDMPIWLARRQRFEVYEALEGEGYRYTIRLLANRILQDRIGYLLTRPVGRPLRHLSDARDRVAEGTIRANPEANRRTATTTSPNVRPNGANASQ